MKQDFTITCNPVPNGRTEFTVCIEGRIVHAASIDLSNKDVREEFFADCAAKGIDRTKLESTLLSIVADESKMVQDGEIDVDQVIRSERFILDDLNGLSVPILMESGAGITGGWFAYVKRGTDRERIEIQPKLQIGDSQVYVSPIPGSPDISQRPSWSRTSRNRWLMGQANVSPKQLFENLASAFNSYLEFPSDRKDATISLLICWTVLTYCYVAWSAVPYLFVTGPAHSGKSTLFGVLARLVFRPFATENVTVASIFRTLNERGGTLLYDEAERLRNTSNPDIAEINSVLLGGYKAGGAACRLEKIGDGFRMVTFQVFGPKAIACINPIPPTLASRSIEICMSRAHKSCAKPKRRFDEFNWQEVRDDLHILTLEYGPDWLECGADSDACPKLGGRDYEKWQPILSVAKWFERNGVEQITELLGSFAETCVTESIDYATPEADSILIQVLADMMSSTLSPKAGDLLAAARIEHGSLFDRWTPKGVATRLKNYGLTTMKTNGDRVYRILDDQFLKIQRLYGLDLGIEDHHASDESDMD